MLKKTKQLERVQTWAGALVLRSRACGVTVPDLATKALIDRGTIYHWMRGTHVPSESRREQFEAAIVEIEAEFQVRPCPKCGTRRGERRGK